MFPSFTASPILGGNTQLILKARMGNCTCELVKKQMLGYQIRARKEDIFFYLSQRKANMEVKTFYVLMHQAKSLAISFPIKSMYIYIYMLGNILGSKSLVSMSTIIILLPSALNFYSI